MAMDWTVTLRCKKSGDINMFCLLKFKKIAHYRGLEHDVAAVATFFFFCFMSTAIYTSIKTYLRMYNKLQSAYYNFF